MDTLHAQKENVDVNVAGSGAASKMRFKDTKKLSTPKRGFVVHDDSQSASNSSLKDIPSKKSSRRVLSDISNKQLVRHGIDNSSGVVLNKKGLSKGLRHSKKLRFKKRAPLTPLNTDSCAPLAPKARSALTLKTCAKLTPTSARKTPDVEDIPDIECAYGGLSSPQSESAYVKSLSDEIIQDILNDKTPTMFDDFSPSRVVGGWDGSREKAMLESGEPPSFWWASPNLETNMKTEGHDTKEDETEEDQVEDDLTDLPPPDNLPDDNFANVDDDGLLEDLLSVDVEAVCSE